MPCISLPISERGVLWGSQLQKRGIRDLLLSMNQVLQGVGKTGLLRIIAEGDLGNDRVQVWAARMINYATGSVMGLLECKTAFSFGWSL